MRPDDPPAASPSLEERDTLFRAPAGLATDPTLAAGAAPSVTDPTLAAGSQGAGEATTLRVISRDGYVIEGHFAQGGIGRILRARDRHLERPVAVKELLVAGSGDAERRFIREALLTARLQHPGIVPIYEAGRWPSGEAFYAMKLVSGRALFDIIAATRTLDERLALLPNVLALAEAVGYAHAQGVIHRDLKPENVLVGDFGETIVIDWGLAKDLREAGPDDSQSERNLSSGTGNIDAGDSGGSDMSPRTGSIDPDLTMAGAVMGTPSYMAPEQAEGKPVDARADVYALGSILYHVLTGEPPYDASAAMAIVVKVVTEDPVPVTVRQPGVPRDLAAILEKAMARDPAARYPSAKEMADDLRRFQTGKLVAAHHYSAGERLWRWIRRNRTAIAVALVALVVTSVVGVASIRSVIHEKEAARAAEAAARSAEEQALRRADDLAVEQARHLASTLPGRSLDLLASVGDRTRWPRLRVIAADADAHGVPLSLLGHQAGISRVAFSPESALLASTSDDCTLRIWDLRGGDHKVLAGHRDQVWRVAFSPDGATVATTSKDGTVRLWDPRSGAQLREFVDTSPTRAVAYATDGRHLITSNDATELRSWDLVSGDSTLLTRCEASYVFTNGRLFGCVAVDRRSIWLGDPSGARSREIAAGDRRLGASGAISSDGRYLAVSSEDGALWLWDLTYDKIRRLQAGDALLRAVAFSPDGEHVAAGSADRNAYLFRVESGELRHVLRGADSPVIRLDFSASGDYLVGVASEPRVHLWSVVDGGDHSLGGLSQAALAAAFSPDGRRLAGVSVNGELRLWEPGELVARRLGDRSMRQTRGALFPDASAVVSGSEDGSVDLWRLDDALPRRLGAHARAVDVIRFSDAGDRFVTLDVGGDAVVWSRSGERLAELASPVGPVLTRNFALTPDGRRAGAVYGPEVYAWDLETREARHLGTLASAPRTSRLTPDGRGLLLVGQDDRVILWDLVSGARRDLTRHERRAVDVDVTPDGALVVSGGDEHQIFVYDLTTDTSWSIPTQGLEVHHLAVHPDGRRVAVAARNNVITLWDLRARVRVRELVGHVAAVNLLTFVDGGASMISVAVDGELRLWDLATGESRALPSSARILEYSASPDGRVLLTRTYESELRVWRDDLPRDQAGFYGWLDGARRPLTGPPVPPEVAASCPSLAATGDPAAAP
ncbi:MAG: protein kinase [Nannocystaceae bacterium]